MDNGPCIHASGGRTQLISPIREGGATKDECVKLVASFNREVAIYCTLAISLGGSSDCERLRDELKHSRQRACELAHMNKTKLIPLLRSKMRHPEEHCDLERLYRLYSGCLELLQVELTKTASLQEAFPLCTGTAVLINTGILDSVSSHRTYVSIEQLDQDRSDRIMLEKEEVLRIDRAARDIQEIVYSVSQALDIQPWDIEPDITTEIECRKSLSSGSDAESTLEITPMAHNRNTVSRKKCVCIAMVTIVTVIICCSIVGLLVGFLY